VTAIFVTLLSPTVPAPRSTVQVWSDCELLGDPHVVTRAASAARIEVEGTVGIDRQVVAAVVPQDQARPFEIAHCAADREIGSAAAHEHISDIGAADRAAGLVTVHD
jgi:hypothetical protein